MRTNNIKQAKKSVNETPKIYQTLGIALTLPIFQKRENSTRTEFVLEF